MGRTGHWPVPAGDSPAGREGRQETIWCVPSATVPSGESPLGTGESPVPPSFFCMDSVECFRFSPASRRPIHDLTNKRLQLAARLRFVALRHLRHERFGGVIGNEIYRRAAEARADGPRAVAPGV